MKISSEYSKHFNKQLQSLNNQNKNNIENSQNGNTTDIVAEEKLVYPKSNQFKAYFTGNHGAQQVQTSEGTQNTQTATKLDKQIKNLEKFMDLVTDKIDTGEIQNMVVPEAVPVEKISTKEQVRNDKTINLFKKNIDSYMWTGEECSDPIYPNKEAKQDQRWDQLQLINLYDDDVIDKHLRQLNKLGIKNLRMGVPQHLIANDNKENPLNSKGELETLNLDLFDSTAGKSIKKYAQGGKKISLDLQHFGLPDQFKNEDYSKSYFLNEKWPEYHARVAKSIMKDYGDSIAAVTLVNEPYVTNLFSGGMWNEKCPGWTPGGHPNYDRFTIKRGILMAEAAVKSKMEIEKHIQQQPDPESAKKVYVHNEAIDKRTDNEVSNKYFRFISSDLMLGQDWLLKEDKEKKTDFKNTDMYKWMVERYTNTYMTKDGKEAYLDDQDNEITDPAKVEENKKLGKKELESKLTDLKNLHLQLKKETGKTMMDDTVFGVDYYTTNEGGGPGCELSSKTSDYADEVKSGKRKGLYGVTKEYWNRYKLPILHTETNCLSTSNASSPKHSVKWGLQQLVELNQLNKSGIPVLGANWYSLNDQFGWNKFLNFSPEVASKNLKQYQNPIGLIDPLANEGAQKEFRPAGKAMEALIKILE